MEKTIVITVEGGCVIDVAYLPEGWNYQINDLDDDQDDEPLEDELNNIVHEK